jgi:hypothetical protein
VPLLFGLFEQRQHAHRMTAQSLIAGRIGLQPLGRITPRAVEHSIAKARAFCVRAQKRFGDQTPEAGDHIDRIQLRCLGDENCIFDFERVAEHRQQAE